MGSLAVVNGRIYVSFNPLRVVDGLLALNGKVVYIGSSNFVKEIAGKLNVPLLNLAGRVVLPGFVDSHLHIDSLGLSLVTLDLRGVRSIGELKKKLKEYAMQAKTAWILGHGWDHEVFEEKRWPTRWDIDEVVPDKPVLLTRICLHAGVVNTAAIKETNLLKQPLAGVVRNEKGEVTGVLLEDALKYVREHVKREMKIEEIVELVKTAQYHLLSNGVTTAGVTGCGFKTLRAMFELWRRRELRVRFRVYVYPWDSEASLLELLLKLGVRTGFGDEYFRILGVKMFMDGSLGARTAWLSSPYSDDPSTSGYPVTQVDELARTARLVDEHGLQLAVHAIGDKAVETVLTIFRELRNYRLLRHRVEHASLVREDLLQYISELKPPIVVQPRFIISDWWALRRLGESRVKWLYCFKTLLERDANIAFSTDAPVEPVNPWETIYAAVTRGKYEAVPFYEHTKQESLSVQDALHAYTAGSAYALHGEHELGTLEPGKLADFVVVDKDPLSVNPLELRSIRVLEVYVGGERAWPP